MQLINYTIPNDFNNLKMTTEEFSIAFKEKLVKTLDQLGRNLLTTDVFLAVQSVLSQQEEQLSYVIGHEIFDRLGMDDNKHIYIAGPYKQVSIEVGDFVVKFLEQRNTVSKDHIPYLQILDIVLIFRFLRESQLKSVMKKFGWLIEQLSHEERKLLIQLARKYPVCVRAVLGFVLNNIQQPILSARLLQTISPAILLRYKHKISSFLAH